MGGGGKGGVDQGNIDDLLGNFNLLTQDIYGETEGMLDKQGDPMRETATDLVGDLRFVAGKADKEVTDLRQTMASQLMEALVTGGVGARTPIIAKALEGTKRATSNSLKALDQRLAQQKLAGTPFGERIRSETMQKGKQAEGAVAPRMTMDFINQIIPFLSRQDQFILSAMTGAGNILGQQQGALGSQASVLPNILAAYSGSLGPSAQVGMYRDSSMTDLLGTIMSPFSIGYSMGGS